MMKIHVSRFLTVTLLNGFIARLISWMSSNFFRLALFHSIPYFKSRTVLISLQIWDPRRKLVIKVFIV